MTIPNVSINIADGGLGIVPQLNNNTVAVVGVSSSGTANQVNSFGPGNVKPIQDALGTGPLVEEAAALVNAGCPVITCKTNTTTAGTAGSVTKTGSVGSSAMTITGTPLDSYELLVLVTQSGVNTSGLGALKISLDGGLSYGPEVALPVAASYPVPNTGLTLVFGTGGVGATDTYAATCTGPTFSNTDLQTALTALLADPRTWFLLDLVGIPPDASTMGTFFGTMDTNLQAAAAAYRYARGIMSGPWGVSDSNLITAMNALSSTRVGVGADWGRDASILNGRSKKTSASTMAAVRAASIDPGTDAARVIDGALTGLVSLNRNEEATPGLDMARFTTLRSYIGLPGYYLTNFRLASAPTSDFQYIQHGRCIDIACTIARNAFLRFLSDAITVNKTTGLILETEARRIENYVLGQLRGALTQPGYVSNVQVNVSRTDNLLATQTLNATVRVTPKAYPKTIVVGIGLANPALASS